MFLKHTERIQVTASLLSINRFKTYSVQETAGAERPEQLQLVQPAVLSLISQEKKWILQGVQEVL